jgi:tRNA modification GTPase
MSEAIIDFGEDEGIEDEIYNDGTYKLGDYADSVRKRVQDLVQAIQSHLTSSMKGSLLQTGIRTVLLGAPNAGKSSLLNILAQRPASIVSPEPGTTRDVVEVLLDIAGFPCVVGDTAGLRDGETIGGVEREGVLRAKNRAASSDLRILVVDASLRPIQKGLQEVDSYLKSDDDVSTVLILNKIDLVNDQRHIKEQYSSTTGLPEELIFPVSCLTRDGIDEFGSGMTKLLQNMTGSRENILATNERQRRLLSECISHLQAFLRLSPSLANQLTRRRPLSRHRNGHRRTEIRSQRTRKDLWQSRSRRSLRFHIPDNISRYLIPI